MCVLLTPQWILYKPGWGIYTKYSVQCTKKKPCIIQVILHTAKSKVLKTSLIHSASDKNEMEAYKRFQLMNDVQYQKGYAPEVNSHNSQLYGKPDTGKLLQMWMP